MGVHCVGVGWWDRSVNFAFQVSENTLWERHNGDGDGGVILANIFRHYCQTSCSTNKKQKNVKQSEKQ